MDVIVWEPATPEQLRVGDGWSGRLLSPLAREPSAEFAGRVTGSEIGRRGMTCCRTWADFAAARDWIGRDAPDEIALAALPAGAAFVELCEQVPAATAALAWGARPGVVVRAGPAAWREWAAQPGAIAGGWISGALPAGVERLYRDGAGELPAELPRLTFAAAATASIWRERIAAARPRDLVPEIGSDADAVAVKAGLLQFWDAETESHELAQSIEGLGRRRSGDYWHAILHRREPDDANAKYWFRQVGRHPVYNQLAARARPLLAASASPAAQTWSSRIVGEDAWNPAAFVDFCAACRASSDTALVRTAEELQFLELILLLRETCADARSAA